MSFQAGYKGVVTVAGGVLKVTESDVEEKLALEEVARTGSKYMEYADTKVSLQFKVGATYDDVNPPAVNVGDHVAASVALYASGKTWTGADVIVSEASYKIDPKGATKYNLTLTVNGAYTVS